MVCYLKTVRDARGILTAEQLKILASENRH